MRRRVSATSVLGLVLVLSGSAAQAASLDHERRVAAHRAVERVLWERRIWPEANPEPKPPLEAVLPESALRAKVEEVLRRSNALATLWHRPVGPAELQAEIERMTRDSQAPDTLEAMFDAVDRDPLLVAEVIARPVLVDRLIHAWYARDPRFHVETRARAERDLSLAGSAADLEETDTAFTATVGNGIASWPKTSFETWWSGERARFAPVLPDLDDAALSAIPIPAGASCADDTWTPTSPGPPTKRWLHTAVWTGTEMIVWGGIDSPSPVNTGGRYNPSTDSWAPIDQHYAPTRRDVHAAVWTGTRMIVWGGRDTSGNAVNTGGRYDPITDTWTDTTILNAPAERIPKVAVWTGSRMIVWGGNILLPGSGGQYDPVADTWTATSTTGAPVDGGSRPEGVWTGTRMIVWPGARYDPVADAWSPISGAGEPVGRTDHTVVWTGSRMIVWGGYSGDTPRGDGGVYDPAANTWSETSLVGSPSNRGHHVAAWVQNRMVIWGGEDNSGPLSPFQSGGRYDPVSNTWSPTSLTGAPERRYNHTAVATANEMIVWGGFTGSGVVSTGGRYSPASDSWVPTKAGGSAPTARHGHSFTWTGTEAIAWGGYSVDGYMADGARYAPATDSWTPTATTGAPVGGTYGSAVWTGTRLIVWGGINNIAIASGGRYDPVTDSWTPTTMTSAPAPRRDHTAVWTGSRMIVWGGESYFGGGSDGLNTGAVYDPGSDAWTATATTGAPNGRALHTAVWTGSRMVVWGGMVVNGGPTYDSGGLYDPASNTWTPTATAGAPLARREHVAVWTGSRMLVWGGADQGDVALGTGSSYDPAGNVWAPLPATGAPAIRRQARAVWTGAEMIVWGGTWSGPLPYGYLDSGGRYRPADDSWRATSLIAAPDGRHFHGMVWTGGEVIVWGGLGTGVTRLNDGGRYCACTPWYPDGDGDGFGDLFNPVTTCDGIAPAGLIGRGGDCHDGNAAIHPGVADATCNEVDEDCDNQLDEDFLVQPTLCGAGVCRDFGALECIGGQVVNTCVPLPPNSAVDDTCNNLDDDCEGGVDEEFPIYIDQWIPIASAPVSRTNYTAVSSGTEFLVFGGDNGSGVVQTGGVAYDVAANTWRSLPVGPAKRWHHTAVWADTRMIVWGGDDGSAVIYNSGSRYDPVANTWAATTTTGAPTARGGHSAVWTGSRMVIWGGRDVGNHFNTGSRYDPVANSWSATTTTGAPTARWLHTAVWTGTQMLVWGGQSSTNAALNTGGRYDPSSNTWTAISTTNAPSARYGHVAVWTGTEMIVWGGTSAATTYLNSGARYNPSTDTWTTMAILDAPSRRAWASAVWNGYEFVVWGGTYRTNEEPDTALGNGGKYYPGNNVWVPINPFSTAPSPRARTMAVLQAGEMIVWGGDPNGGALATGARHVPFTLCGVGGCLRQAQTACSGGTISFQCTPGIPQPEICDGYDNDCNATIDDVPVPTGSPTMFGTKLVDNTIVLTWSAIPNATAYDMVRGSLVTLRATGGDFTTATCIQNDNPMTQGWDVPVAPPGDGTWYLVRPVNSCAGNGSYDGPSPPQQGSRDSELGACP